MILSCDPGVDDALALAVLAGRPDCALEAVVAVGGNVRLELTLRNACGLVEAFGMQVPVGRGSARALAGPFPGDAANVHGGDGLGGTAWRLPRGRVPVDDGLSLFDREVIATGPLTDAARVLLRGDPIDRLVWMGGAVQCPGNVTPHAEFNAWCDPEAADLVLRSGVPVWMVPLDVTARLPLSTDDLTAWRHSKRGALCAGAASGYAGGTGFLHDPAAIIGALEPGLFRWRETGMRCETHGEARGATVLCEGPPVQLAFEIDAPAVRRAISAAITTD